MRSIIGFRMSEGEELRVALFSMAMGSKRPMGLGRYATELMFALQEQPDICRVTPVRIGRAEAREGDAGAEAGMACLGGSFRRTLLTWLLFGRPLIEEAAPEVDIVHNAAAAYPIGTRKPLVVTVHDLGPLTHPELFRGSRPWLFARGLRQAADRAAAIICISRATAAETAEFLGRDDLPITVIHHGIPGPFTKAPDLSLLSRLEGMPAEGTPFFLFAGSLNPRKNMLRILEAFETVADKVEQHLVIVSDSGWDQASTLERLRAAARGGKVHFIPYVDDRTLAALYSSATAFVFPSLFEGFGFPLLEAMALGCPVITSNLSSMPEVAGDAAMLVDPTDVPEMAEAMSRIATDESARKELVSRGLVRSREFSWERCAGKVAEVYKDVIKRERSRP